MRFVNRNMVHVPVILNSSTAISFAEEVKEYLSQLDKEKRPPKPPEEVLRGPELISALRQLFNDSCAYCEAQILSSDEQVDHFRPMSGAQGAFGKVDFAHYIWLAVEWQNLFLACSACLRAKRNLFPVQERGNVSAPVKELRRKERGTILDPCHDHAFEHLTLSESGHLRPKSERGNTSIEVLDLNRVSLVQDRKQYLEHFREALETYNFAGAKTILLAPGCFSGTLWLWALDRVPKAEARAARNLQDLASDELIHILKQVDLELDTPTVQGYCESSYAALMPVDVEHFRPKGKVIDSAGNAHFPGYWFLASSWTNLLPSCIDCNRSRWHKDGSERQKFGKECFFPLQPHGVYATDLAGVANEPALLLNPAESDPKDHLQFVQKKTPAGKKESIVVSKRDVAGNSSSKGQKSIDVFGLNRPKLCDARNSQLRALENALKGVEALYEAASEMPEGGEKTKALAKEQLKEAVDIYLRWNRPYASACRALYKTWATQLSSKRQQRLNG